MNNKFKMNIIYIIFFIIFFFTIYILNYYTPLQSDDYGYSLIGFDIQKHVHHYLTWSGRVVADIISPLILLIRNNFLLSAIQTIGVFTIIFLIAKFKDYSFSNNLFILSAISFIFFLSHPSFGQANLWIVGSANYLWTSILYIYVVREVLYRLQGGNINFIVYPISIIAGCTNENASIAILGIVIISIFLSFLKRRTLDFKLVTILILILVGSVILLASPGNESRLMDPSFNEWREMSFHEKLNLHLFERMPDVFKDSKLAYFLSIFLIVFSISKCGFKLFTEDKKPTNLLIAILLLSASIGCSLIMLLSPAFPDRAKTPSFIFCLMSIPYAIRYCFPNNIYPKPLHIIYFFIFFVFLAEAVAVISTYKSIYKQNKIRLDIIYNNDSSDVTLIPEFYFKRLPNGTYKFDTWTNFDAMSTYYNKNKITAYGTAFDFSVINDNAYKIHGSNDMSTKLGLVAIYMYSENYTMDTIFLFEVTHQERLSANANQKVFFHVTDMNGNHHNFDFEPNYAYVNDRVFLYTKLKKMPYWFIKNASFGIFDINNPSFRYSQIDFNI